MRHRKDWTSPVRQRGDLALEGGANLIMLAHRRVANPTWWSPPQPSGNTLRPGACQGGPPVSDRSTCREDPSPASSASHTPSCCADHPGVLACRRWSEQPALKRRGLPSCVPHSLGYAVPGITLSLMTALSTPALTLLVEPRSDPRATSFHIYRLSEQPSGGWRGGWHYHAVGSQSQ